jgi:hypothetical protein
VQKIAIRPGNTYALFCSHRRAPTRHGPPFLQSEFSCLTNVANANVVSTSMESAAPYLERDGYCCAKLIIVQMISFMIISIIENVQL